MVSQNKGKFNKFRNELFSWDRNLANAENDMSQLSTGLDNVDKQVAVLREQLAESTREASQIEIGMHKARQTLSVSQNLVTELDDEYKRWRIQVFFRSLFFTPCPHLSCNELLHFHSNQ